MGEGGAAPDAAADERDHAAGLDLVDERDRRRVRRWLGGLSLFGLLARLVLLPAGHGTARFLSVDAIEYLKVAKAFPSVLWDPHGVVMVYDRHVSLLDLSVNRTPGYPLFLWIVTGGTGNATAAVVANAVIGGVVTVLLTYLVALRLLPGRRGLAVAAAAVVATDPMSIAQGFRVLTETLFTAVALVAALAILRWMRERTPVAAAWAGLAMALTVFVRPTTTYLIPVVAVLALLARPRPRAAVAAGVFAVTAVVPLGLWAWRNDHLWGAPMVSSIEAVNMFGLRAAGAISEERGISLGAAQAELNARYRRDLVGHSEADVASFQRSQGLVEVLHHPVGYAKSAARGLEQGVVGPAWPWIAKVLPPGVNPTVGRAVDLATRAHVVAFWFLAIVGAVVAARRRQWRLLWFVGIPTAYLLLISAGPEMKARFRVPVVPFVAVLIAVALGAGWEWWRRRGQAAAGVEPTDDRSGPTPAPA